MIVGYWVFLGDNTMTRLEPSTVLGLSIIAMVFTGNKILSNNSCPLFRYCASLPLN